MKKIKTSSLFINLFLFLSFSIIFFFRLSQSRPKYTDGDKIRISSRISSEPVLYTNQQLIKINSLKIWLNRYPELSYGDSIVVEGKVQKGEIKNPKLVSHTHPQALSLFSFRNSLISFYQQSLPSPHDALVAGVVLGSKNSLSDSFWQNLRATGTLHVVVASGMNVTLVSSFLINFLIKIINRKKAILIALLAIWLYAILAGFDAPIVRAAIMGSLTFTAQATGTLYTAWRALFVSVALMLLSKPLWYQDLGFILSFVATASILAFDRFVYNKLRFVPSVVKQDLSTTLAAQIGVAPILFLVFGQFNPFSPFINALILWTIPPLTILGAFAGIVGLLIPALGRILLLLIFPLTSWFVFVVNALA